MKKAQINLSEWIAAVEDVYGVPPPDGWISAPDFGRAHTPPLTGSTARDRLKRLVGLKRAETKLFRGPNGRLCDYYRLKKK